MRGESSTPRVTWRSLVAGAVAAATLIAGAVTLPAGAAGAARDARHARHHFTVGVSFYTNSIPYIEIRQGMQQEAKSLGITLDFSYSDFSAAEQALQIGSFVSRRVNLILCAPVSTSLLVPAFRAARKAGVPIIAVANKLPSPDETGFIGGTWSLIGRDQMAFVDKELHGAGEIAEITGPPTLDYVEGERRGWASVLSQDRGLDLVAVETDPTVTESEAEELAGDILSAHPGVRAIVASTDTIAEGVGEALQLRGVRPGAVVVTGVYATPQVVASIRSHGYVRFTISVKAVTWGEEAIELAQAWLTGHRPKDHTIATPYRVVTPSDVGKLTTKDLL